MMELKNIISFYPDKYVYTVRKIWIDLIQTTAILIILISIVAFINSKANHSSSPWLMLIIFIPIFIANTLTKKYPIAITIDKERRIFKLEYLTALGKTKLTVIMIDKARLRLVDRYNYKYDPEIKRQMLILKIYDNILNNWVKIGQGEGYSKELLIEIYETVRNMKAT